MLDQRIGLIGAGQMATALAHGFIKAGLTTADRLVAADVDERARQRFAQALSVHATADNALVAAQSDVIILAVKPQQLATVAAGLRGKIGPERLVVSIAAGVRLASLAEWLGTQVRIIRVMPNTPWSIRCATSMRRVRWCSVPRERLCGISTRIFASAGFQRSRSPEN